MVRPSSSARTRTRRGRAAADEVGLEQLDAVEAGVRCGRELLLERAAQAHGGDRLAHRHPHRWARPVSVSSAKWLNMRSTVGLEPGEQRERQGGLEYRHAAAVERAAAERARACRSNSVSSGRYTTSATHRPACSSSAGSGSPGWLSIPIGVALISPSARASARGRSSSTAALARRRSAAPERRSDPERASPRCRLTRTRSAPSERAAWADCRAGTARAPARRRTGARRPAARGRSSPGNRASRCCGRPPVGLRRPRY